jgi:hypothetical protein
MKTKKEEKKLASYDVSLVAVSAIKESSISLGKKSNPD